MGEVADDMVDGLACSWCGVYFRKAHGYPVACAWCWKNATERDKQESAVQKAFEREL